jgi:hypothetical protein
METSKLLLMFAISIAMASGMFIGISVGWKLYKKFISNYDTQGDYWMFIGLISGLAGLFISVFVLGLFIYL